MTTTPADAPVAPTASPAARAVDLTKIYGEGDTEVRALDGVTVDFARGQFTAIMGPSGSGKSTLMHCVAGLDTATSGTVQIGDTDYLAQRQGAHPAAPRPHRVRVPGVQPGADAQCPREHHAAPRHRRPEGRPGVARHGDRHHRPARPAEEPPQPAVRWPAAARRRAPGRWRAGPRSSSPTSPQATSTRARAPRSWGSSAGASTASTRPSSW